MRIAIWSALVIGLCSATPGVTLAADGTVEAERLYYEGRSALKAGDPSAAMKRFDEALSLDIEPDMQIKLLRAFGLAAEKVIEQDRALACAAVRRYQTWLGRAPADDEARPEVEAARQRLVGMCDDGLAGAPAEPRDRMTLWLLSGSAAVSLLAGAVFHGFWIAESAEYGDAVDTLRTTSDPDRQRELIATKQDIQARAPVFEASALSFYTVGGLLAAGAVWAWLSEDEDAGGLATANLLVGPGMISVGGRW